MRVVSLAVPASLAADNVSPSIMSYMTGSGWDKSSAGDTSDSENESVIELAEIVTIDAAAATCVVGERTGHKVLLAYQPTT